MFISVEITVLSFMTIVETILISDSMVILPFYGNTYDWDSGSNYTSGSLSIPSWADVGYYDVQVYDYNTWSWLTLNEGFYVHQPPSPSFTISPDNGEQGETPLMFI